MMLQVSLTELDDNIYAAAIVILLEQGEYTSIYVEITKRCPVDKLD